MSADELKECREAFESNFDAHANLERYYDTQDYTDDAVQALWNGWRDGWRAALNRRAPAQVAAGLTDEEITKIKHREIFVNMTGFIGFARAIEAKVQAAAPVAEQVEKDAARLDWCISVLYSDGWLTTDTGCGCCGDGMSVKNEASGRAAIDAAMLAITPSDAGKEG